MAPRIGKMTSEATWRQHKVAESEVEGQREKMEVVLSGSRDWIAGSLAGERAEETRNSCSIPDGVSFA